MCFRLAWSRYQKRADTAFGTGPPGAIELVNVDTPTDKSHVHSWTATRGSHHEGVDIIHVSAEVEDLWQMIVEPPYICYE
jgi:hypothetical protein